MLSKKNYKERNTVSVASKMPPVAQHKIIVVLFALLLFIITLVIIMISVTAPVAAKSEGTGTSSVLSDIHIIDSSSGGDDVINQQQKKKNWLLFDDNICDPTNFKYNKEICINLMDSHNHNKNDKHGTITTKEETNIKIINNDESSSTSIYYESPDVEWCRRRPTWRNINYHDDDVHNNDDNYVWETCSKLLNYSPNPKALSKGNHPFLSSTWNDTYNFDPYFIYNEIDKQQRDEFESLPIMERPIIQQLIRCMDNKMKNHELIKASFFDEVNDRRGKTNTRSMVRPTIKKMHYNDDDDDELSIMVVVQDALNEIEAHSVEILSECLREGYIDKFTFNHREFDETDEGGGNDCTFLSGFLQLLLPGVAYQVKHVAYLVWTETQWGNMKDPIDLINSHTLQQQEQKQHNNNNPFHQQCYNNNVDDDDNRLKQYSTKWGPNPHGMGIRTTEYLSYNKWGNLGYHLDSESVYTVLIALSNPEDYDGGEFTLFPEYNQYDDDDDEQYYKTKISFKPDRLDAVVFLSESLHGVEAIHTPGRKMFTNELWRYDDAPTFVLRPAPEDIVYGNPNRMFDFDDEYPNPFPDANDDDYYDDDYYDDDYNEDDYYDDDYNEDDYYENDYNEDDYEDDDYNEDDYENDDDD